MIDYDGLRRHRDKIFNDILKMLETNQRVGCVQPTGIGKSYCIARLCNKLKGKKLVLEPGTEVINYMQLFDIETPDTDYITYHSLLRPSATDLANMFKEYDYIFLDEMHRALAPKWGKQLDKTFAILDVLEASYKILGFSATPTRMDNRDAVEEIFQGVQIEPYYLQDAILDGILPNIEYHSSIYEITDKDRNKLKLKDTPLAKQILSYDIDEGVSKIFQENLDLTQPHHIIVFVDKIANISEAIENMKKWLKVDFSIYQAHSKMSYKESKEAIENFQKDENLSLMFAVDILNEGVHLDKVDTSVFLRKTSSTRVYNQQLGRVVSDTVENPKVFDLVNNIDNLDTGYAFMFKEKTNQLKVKTEQLITKNGEHLKIITHQEDLIEKLKRNLMSIRYWTKDEDDFLKENYRNMTNIELSTALNRTVCSIESRKHDLGLLKPKLVVWTDKEINVLKLNYHNMNNKELSNILDKTVSQIKTMKKELGLSMIEYKTQKTIEHIKFIEVNSDTMTDKEMSKILGIPRTRVTSLRISVGKRRHSYNSTEVRYWTKDEDDFIINNCNHKTDREISIVLNRTDNAVKARRQHLGIKCHKVKYFWSENDDKYLIDNYVNSNIEDLAIYLDRSAAAVQNRAEVLGLNRGLANKWTDEEITILIDECKKLECNFVITQKICYDLSTKLNHRHPHNSIRSKISWLRKHKFI